MNEPLDELYLKWLYTQIASPRLKNPERTYWNLAKQMFTKRFVWIVPNDDNRQEEGKELRIEFLTDLEIPTADPNWLDIECSFLEMLVSLSRRLAFLADGEVRGWVNQLLDNLDIRASDAQYNNRVAQIVDETMDRVIWRQYDYNGNGGLFPLQNPREDQTQVELWYQLNAYLNERD